MMAGVMEGTDDLSSQRFCCIFCFNEKYAEVFTNLGKTGSALYRHMSPY